MKENKQHTPTTKDTPNIAESVYSDHINFYMVDIVAHREVAKYLNNSERKVVNYLIDSLDFSSNIVVRTYNQIMHDAHVSRNTVSTTLKKLAKLSIIKHKSSIIYFNPDVILTGSKYKKKQLNDIYNNI